MFVPSPLCRTARIFNKLLWKKLVGNASKRFPSGKWISDWHSGHSCVFFQTLTAERVKTRYNFWFFEGFETNWASNLFREVSHEGLHCKHTRWLLVNALWKSYCLKFREKQDVADWPCELKLNIFTLSGQKLTRGFKLICFLIMFETYEWCIQCSL